MKPRNIKKKVHWHFAKYASKESSLVVYYLSDAEMVREVYGHDLKFCVDKDDKITDISGKAVYTIPHNDLINIIYQLGLSFKDIKFTPFATLSYVRDNKFIAKLLDVDGVVYFNNKVGDEKHD